MAQRKNKMTIFFIRHAIALDRKMALQQKIIDSERQLTDQGIKKFSHSIKKYEKKFKKVDLFVTSPYLRAQETLDLVLKLKTSKKAKKKIYKFLRPDDKPNYFLKWAKNSGCKKMVVVSHEPFISVLMQHVLKDQWKSKKIKKGQVVKLKI